MKKIAVVLFLLTSIVTFAIVSEPMYKVSAMKNETQKYDSLIVPKSKLESAIDKMSKVKNVYAIQIELTK